MAEEENEIVDLSDGVDQDSMPCCPICDNFIFDWEPCCLIIAHGCKALAHTECTIEMRQDLGI